MLDNSDWICPEGAKTAENPGSRRYKYPFAIAKRDVKLFGKPEME